MAGDSVNTSFNFQLLSKEFRSLESKDLKELLQKWGMDNKLFAQAYSFNEEFKPYQMETFAKEFFTSDIVLGTLWQVGHQGSKSILGKRCTRVEVTSVPCTCISMSLFDKLQEHGIVRDNGSIQKCFDEYSDGVVVADQLRQVLLNEDSDNYHIYSEEERSEFLFRLFSHICVGGGVCQYEDDVTPYIQNTKLLYKDLISVQKSAETSDLHVITRVYKVNLYDDDDMFYPDSDDHINSFSYLIVDPIRRNVTVLHHRYCGGL